MKNWVASVLALVAAAGTIATIVLWIEIGAVCAAITFATTITLIYVVVRSAEAEVAAPAFIASLNPTQPYASVPLPQPRAPQLQEPQSQVPAEPPSSGGSETGGSEISLRRQGGVQLVPVTINDAITLPFVIDSGASDVLVTADVAMTLARTGTVSDSDFLPSQTFELADGSTVPSPTLRIRSLKVGDREVHDVVASISDVEGSLLLGQSFLRRFTTWSVDNQRQVLVLTGTVMSGPSSQLRGYSPSLAGPPDGGQSLGKPRSVTGAGWFSDDGDPQP
jgi:predicted aspartyl protease